MSKIRYFVWIVFLSFASIVVSGATVVSSSPTSVQSIAPAPIPVATPAANGLVAREYLEDLVETIGPRIAGTEGEAQAAGYIRAAFEEMDYETADQPFSFATEDEDDLNSTNIIAFKEGVSSLQIVVGAHYDSTGDGMGADDNASGVAAMLEVAERVAEVETPYTIRFVAFGAEENDLDGSRYYVDQMSESDIENLVAMINLDGLIAGDIAYVYGDEGPGTIRDWILHTAQGKGLSLDSVPVQYLDNEDGTPCDCADYGPFQDVGVPFVFFEATNWNLGEEDGMTQVDPQFGESGVIRHTQYDGIGYIDATFPGRVDRHLNLFVTLLYDTLTQYDLPD